MALEDYKGDMETCCRCSACKFIPLENARGLNNVNICPSITRYNFHAYSGGGRLSLGMALLDKELDFSEKFLEVVYNCQMCGGCDISCKYAMDMEVLEPIQETRIRCVETGHVLPLADKLISGLRQNGRLMGGTGAQGETWFKGSGIKDYTQHNIEVIYHAGCRTAYDKSMWKIAQSTAALFQKAGVNFGIGGDSEICCGGRAYQMGYKQDFLNQAKKNMELIKKSGAKILVTGCAECYHAFKVLYDKFGLKGDLQVLHTSEYFARLIQEGKLKPRNKIDLKVTYHDPCHLGRLGEPYIHWEGKQIPGQIRLFDPPKEFRRGYYGVYEPPREVLRDIPGISLVEMDRTKEYAWCCGAGGGVKETNPEFAAWTAAERLKEAVSTGAGAIVTACPGCEKNFSGVLKEQGWNFQVLDVVELLARACQ